MDKSTTKKESLAKFMNLAELPCVGYTARRYLPESSGVYVVLDELNRPIYIGIASNFMTRWKAHDMCSRLLNIPHLRIAWVEMSLEKAKRLEPDLIQHYSPLFNRQFNYKPSLIHSYPIHFSSPEASAAFREAVPLGNWREMSLSLGKLIEDGLRSRGKL